MSKNYIRAWINAHNGMKKTLLYNTDNYTKYLYDNGDTYEQKIMLWTVNRKVIRTYINGLFVSEYVGV